MESISKTHKYYLRFLIFNDTEIKAVHKICKYKGKLSTAGIKPRTNEFIVDIEGDNRKEFFPLRHFKYDKTTKTIVKKSDNEIKAFQDSVKKHRCKKDKVIKEKKKEINDAKLVMLDTNRTNKDRLEAAIKVIQEKI